MKLEEYVANINVVPLLCIRQFDKFPVQNSQKTKDASPPLPFSFALE
jgi:hypothetical protein